MDSQAPQAARFPAQPLYNMNGSTQGQPHWNNNISQGVQNNPTSTCIPSAPTLLTNTSSFSHNFSTTNGSSMYGTSTPSRLSSTLNIDSSDRRVIVQGLRKAVAGEDKKRNRTGKRKQTHVLSSTGLNSSIAATTTQRSSQLQVLIFKLNSIHDFAYKEAFYLFIITAKKVYIILFWIVHTICVVF